MQLLQEEDLHSGQGCNTIRPSLKRLAVRPRVPWACFGPGIGQCV